MSDEVTVTLTLYPKIIGGDREEGVTSQSIDVAKVGNEVSIIMNKCWKRYPSSFAHIVMSQSEACTLVNGILEAIRDNPKDFLKDY